MTSLTPSTEKQGYLFFEKAAEVRQLSGKNGLEQKVRRGRHSLSKEGPRHQGLSRAQLKAVILMLSNPHYDFFAHSWQIWAPQHPFSMNSL